MSIFKLPSWIKPHLFSGREFYDLSEEEVDDLRSRLAKFTHETPDVSIVIPAWNEQKFIHRALSSLASNITHYKVEIVVINNNSTDKTQDVLNRLKVKNYFELEQGPSFARQTGLINAKGKYHLCADSDTLYPPKWIESMVKPMEQDEKIVGVYGRYSFVPTGKQSRWSLFLYERITGVLIKLRKTNHEFINVLGFNMGFVTKAGQSTSGFKVNQPRIFDNAKDSAYFVNEAEDGTMALHLQKIGRIKLLTDVNCWAFTSSRRLAAEGGVFKSFLSRIKFHGVRITEYLSVNNKNKSS
jgi:glycosyltransferase involved in cell wall biosynthesis